MAHLQHIAELNVKILGKSKTLNMDKTEISLNISLIRYYVVFLASLLTALGICRLMRFSRLLSHAMFTVIMLTWTCADS